MSSRIQEPRSITILRHVQGYLHDSATSVQTYADNVRGHYHARTEPHRRTMAFHEGGDVYEDMKANGQLVDRILSRTVRMPVDLEEALVLALPESEQRACWVELGARVGRLSVAHPQEGIKGLTADLSQLFKEFGEVTAAFGPLLEDLAIDERDNREDLEDALNKLRKLVAVEQTFIELIARSLAAKAARPHVVL